MHSRHAALGIALFIGLAALSAQSEPQKAAVRQSLVQEFAKYPLPHSAATSARILNDAALANPGWVLLGKKGGNRCPLADGRDISCDFLVWKVTKRGWDVFSSVGAPNSSVSGPNSSAGEDMTPLLNSGSRTLEDPIGSAPPPVDPPPPPVDLTAILNRLNALEAESAVVRTQMNQLQAQLTSATSAVDALSRALTETNARLFTLEQKPWPKLKCSGRTIFGLPVSCSVVPDVNP